MRKHKILLIVNIISTLIFVGLLSFEIYSMCVMSHDSGEIILIAVALVLFLFHVAILFFPKKVFDFCWKLGNKYMKDDVDDYDWGVYKIPKIGFGCIIIANILTVACILMTHI